MRATSSNAFALAVAIAAWQEATPSDRLPLLRLGELAVGEVKADSPEVRTASIAANLADAPVRGVRYRLELPPGPVTIELKSWFFDAYLVVRDAASGEVVAEDDDGLLRTHARVVLEQSAPQQAWIDAGALHGEVGGYELRVLQGVPPPLDAALVAEAELADLRSEREERERRLGPDHPATAQSTDQLARRLQSRGDHDEALLLFERVLAIREQTLGPEHPETAFSLSNLGGLLSEQGRHARARPLLERALAIVERVLGPDHPETATALNNLALLLREQGLYAEARPLYERTVAICEKALGPDHLTTALGLNNLAGLLQAQGRHAEALALHQRVLAILEAKFGPDHPNLAWCLNNLAWVQVQLGRGSIARPLYERALAIHANVLGATHPLTATSANNLAFLLAEQGRHTEALALYERALAIHEEVYGPDHSLTATSLDNLAAELDALGRGAEARPLYERALAIREATLGPEHRDTATSLNNLAAMDHQQGRLAEAITRMERVQAIQEKTLGLDHPTTAATLANLAVMHHLEGRLADARPLHERALAIREQALGPCHPATTKSLENLALLELDLGDSAAASRARDGLERRRRHALAEAGHVSAAELAALHSARAPTIEIALSAALAAGDAIAQARLLPEVLDFQGAAMRETRRRGTARAASDDAELAAQFDRLDSIRAALTNLLTAEGVDDPAEHDQNLARLRKERVLLEAAVNAQIEARPELQPVEPAQIGAALPPGAVLVDFLTAAIYRPVQRRDGAVVACGEWQAARLFAWVVRSGAAEAICLDLGPEAAIEAAVTKVLTAYGTSRGAAAPRGAAESRGAAAELSKLLWEPLAPWIGDATQLLIVPDGALALLPFGLLETGEGRHLVERCSIALLDDPDDFVRRRTLGDGPRSAPVMPGPAAPSFLLAGAIDYDSAVDRPQVDPEAPAAADARDVAAPVAKLDVRGSFARNWIPLSETRRETSGLARLHQRRFTEASRLALEEEEPTEERLKHELPRHAFLHLATHGYFLADGLKSVVEVIAEQTAAARERFLSDERKLVADDFPSTLCGLVCAGANQLATAPPAGRDNGLLTGEEIAGLDLAGCDLAVLSACETGLGARAFGAAAGQGAMSLSRAFRDAGAKTVISSLWQVRDDSTRELMLDFYDRLWNKGESKLDALRGAQLSMLQKNRAKYGDPLPATWGAFVLTGEWE